MCTAGILGGEVEWYARGSIRASLNDQFRDMELNQIRNRSIEDAVWSGGGGGNQGPSTCRSLARSSSRAP